MNRQANNILFSLLICAITGAAQADLSSTPSASPQILSPPVAVTQARAVGSPVWLVNCKPSTSVSRPSPILEWGSPTNAWDENDDGGKPLSAVTGAVPLPGPSDKDKAVVHELPPGPGSMTLLCTLLLPLGAWQVLRSHNFHLGSVPAWYHSSAPYRIGQAVVYDFDLSPLPLCRFDVVCESANASHCPAFARRDAARRPGLQYFLPVKTPRGPPLPLHFI